MGKLRRTIHSIICTTLVIIMIGISFMENGISVEAAAHEITESYVGYYDQYHNGEHRMKYKAKMHKVDGEMAYCIHMEKTSEPGSAKEVKISKFLPGDELVMACLAQKHIFEMDGYTNAEKYMLTQCMVWYIQRDHIGDGGWRQYVSDIDMSMDEQKTFFSNLEKQVKREIPLYEGDGTAWENVDVEDVQEVGVLFAPKLKTGYVNLKKISSQPQMTEGNSCYSLQGARYGIYGDQACTNLVETLVTDASGNSNTVSIQMGNYWVKELEASKGYELDKTVYPATVKANETAILTVKEKPTNDPASIKLFKIDKESGDVAQGGASLAGAQFTIKFYAGFYTKDNLPESPTRTWVIETKEEKKDDNTISYGTKVSEEYKIGGDDFYTTEFGNVTFPLGTVTIEETKAPEGYLLEGAFLQAEGSTEKIEGKYVSQIRQDGDVAYLTGGNVYTMSDGVKRGDLEFVKIENSTHKRLANVPFTITSKTTKESHTIVTDENGYANTASDWNPHTQNTNRGEAAGDGVWFGLDAEGNNVEVDNTLGALPYDVYTIEEQPCKANEGKKLLESFEVNITRDNHKVNLGTLTNDDKSKVLISKIDATTGKQVEGATLELFKKDGEKWEKVAETVTTDEEWKFTAEPGEYKLVETMAPAGYLMAEAVTFTVADGEAVRRVEMKDEPIEISGNVDKKQTLADGKDKYFYTIDYCSTSNTWADELNLTDPLESVNEGYTRLLSIQTPVSFDDYDGKMNVWYQTNKTDPKDVSDANAYNACSTNPENPANPDNERMTDYTGWKLWKEGVSTLETENLKVSDLKLGEDEYVTAFRFEHGRVSEGFTTRKSKKSKLDAEKNEHDNLKKVVTPHESVFNLKDAENPELKKEQEIHYSPAVLEMEVVSEDYRAGKAELVNSVQLNIFRNKGVTDKLMDEDEDRVVQEYPPKEEPEEPEESGKPSSPSSPSRASGIIKTVQTGLSHHGGWFALAAAALAGAAVVVWRRRNKENCAEEKEEL